MHELDEIRLLDQKFQGLQVFDAGDDEQWAVGDDAQACSAVGRAVIEALRDLDSDTTDALVPILGEQVTDLMRAAADPDHHEFGLFIYRVR